MANIDQIGLLPSSNQKVIVEELIEGELEGIVAGASSTVEQNTVLTTSGSQSISQTSIQESGKGDDKKPPKQTSSDILNFLGIKIELLGFDLKIKLKS